MLELILAIQTAVFSFLLIDDAGATPILWEAGPRAASTTTPPLEAACGFRSRHPRHVVGVGVVVVVVRATTSDLPASARAADPLLPPRRRRRRRLLLLVLCG